MVVLSFGLAYLFVHVNFIPAPASLERGLIDRFIQLLLAIASVFFAVIVTVLVYTTIFFRRQKGDDSDARPIRDVVPLEVVWTVIPLIIVVLLGIYGMEVLDEMSAADPQRSTTQSVFSLGAIVPRNMPPMTQATAIGDELVVNVDAARFYWEFEYPDYGVTSYELVVPVDRRILFNLRSKDVIHSFWVQPWGPKQDAVPGLSPSLRVTPTEIGQYLIQCSQLCGAGHGDMTAPVKVVSASDFDSWLKQQQTAPQATTPPPGQPVMASLAAQNTAFDQQTITVPAGAMVMLTFDNRDSGIPHNFAIYTDASATSSIFIGQIITGPNTVTYTFAAPAAPGNYFFRCDVHPTAMTGTLVVQ